MTLRPEAFTIAMSTGAVSSVMLPHDHTLANCAAIDAWANMPLLVSAYQPEQNMCQVSAISLKKGVVRMPITTRTAESTNGTIMRLLSSHVFLNDPSLALLALQALEWPTPASCCCLQQSHCSTC